MQVRPHPDRRYRHHEADWDKGEPHVHEMRAFSDRSGCRDAGRHGRRYRPDRRAVLQGQDDRHDHRLSAGRQQRRVRPLHLTAHGQVHSRQSDHRDAQYAGRRQHAGRQPHLHDRAQGRHRARHRVADVAARREARQHRRQVQGQQVQLDRANRAGGEPADGVAHAAVHVLEGRPDEGDHAVGDRGGLDRFRLPDGAQQRAEDQVQAGDGLQGLGRVHAGHGARRGRRPQHGMGGGEDAASRLDHGTRRSRSCCSSRSTGIPRWPTCRR